METLNVTDSDNTQCAHCDWFNTMVCSKNMVIKHVWNQESREKTDNLSVKKEINSFSRSTISCLTATINLKLTVFIELG